MAKYKVLITETLRKSVCVEAESYNEAQDKARDMYYLEEVILSADDYLETEFEPIKLSENDTD